MTKELEYNRLVELQNARKESSEIILQFANDNAYWGRPAQNYKDNFKTQKQKSKYDKLFKILDEHNNNFVAYRKKLERKYKFESPIKCYGDTKFAEWFKDFQVEAN